ncbi:DUF4230 domain-containing protein [Arthrobacter mobilis]|uniref:DUF4230 domain-containing protein n=1 Tax=Arthrobacter mobilis TaxID=2724944 RepID=A0A7X6K449_9MICC|nr:DUF4230 domain-containing protein [Arthrobacter mobilis]NKX54235.1 DUF4230 domain-containing protein [Arthrobacter mobilis]
MIVKLFKRIAFVVVGALVALAVLGAANTFGFSPFQSRQTDRSQPALLTSIKDISQYHAAVGNFQVVLDREDDDIAWMPDIIAGRRTLFVAAGTVNAYVDLSGLAEKDLKLSADGKSATVRLPEPQLDKPNLDHDRSYVFMQDRGVLDRIADAIETPQQAQFYRLAETKMTAAAEESELQKRAAENTKAMLTGMFGSLGIQVTFLDDASG